MPLTGSDDQSQEHCSGLEGTDSVPLKRAAIRRRPPYTERHGVRSLQNSTAKRASNGDGPRLDDLGRSSYDIPCRYSNFLPDRHRASPRAFVDPL